MNTKTAITLTKPTVGRRSVGLIGRQSGDSRPILCPILALFLVGRLKKIITSQLYIFFDRPTILGFGDRLSVGRPSADYRATIGRQSADFICE